MRKTRIIIYLGIAILLLTGIAYLNGYRLSPLTVSQELDTKAHFTPSEVVTKSTADGVTTIITRHESWIQCHVVKSVVGVFWKADSIQFTPINLSNPVIPQTEEGLLATYLDACQWNKFKIDPVVILRGVFEIVKPFLGEDGRIVSHKIDHIVKKTEGALQIDSTIVFTSNGNTVTSTYVIYFYNDPDWQIYYTSLNIINIAVPEAITIREYFDWRYLTTRSDNYKGLITIGKVFMNSETFKDEILDLEHGKMEFTAVLTGQKLGWTYIYEERVKAVYDLYKGWVFSISDQICRETLDLTGSWKIDLYEDNTYNGSNIYFKSINNLVIIGQLEYQFSGSDMVFETLSNTVTIDFTFKGKLYQGTVNLYATTYYKYIEFVMDSEVSESLFFGMIISDSSFSVYLIAHYNLYYGFPVELE